MKRPSKVLVGPRWYTVEWRDEADMEMPQTMGYVVPVRGEIVILEGMDAVMEADTFLHEVLHALYFQFSVKQSRPTEEEIVSASASLMTHLWAANPKVFEWWASLL